MTEKVLGYPKFGHWLLGHYLVLGAWNLVIISHIFLSI